MSSFKNLNEMQLGQMWASRFIWYLMEILAGGPLLEAAQRAEMAATLRALDEEIAARGLPVNPAFVEAFATRGELPEADLHRLFVLAYGRDPRPRTPTHGET